MQTVASRLGVTESAWEATNERSFAQVFRELIALGARPDEAEDALRRTSSAQVAVALRALVGSVDE